jgi:small subunit ribosomal protein S17
MSLVFKKPKKSCTDRDCPFHGELAVRGRVLEGIVASAKMERTVVVKRDYLYYVSKFMRYERRHSRISSHNPPCLEVKEGDKVKIPKNPDTITKPGRHRRISNSDDAAPV